MEIIEGLVFPYNEKRRLSDMKCGIRMPSINKSIGARTSLRRMIRNGSGLKAPSGLGWLTSPKKFAYNKIYSRTTFSFSNLFKKMTKL